MILNVRPDASELDNPRYRKSVRLFDKKLVFVILRKRIALCNVILCFAEHSGQKFRSMRSKREKNLENDL